MPSLVQMDEKLTAATKSGDESEEATSESAAIPESEATQGTVQRETFLHRTVKQAATVRSLVLDAILLTLIAAMGLALAWEMSQDTVIVKPLNAPSDLIQQGYTEVILARRLIDDLASIREGARSSKIDRNPNLFPDWSQPDIRIPGAGISLREIVRYAKGVFGEDHNISGEITRGKNGLRLVLRGLNGGAFVDVAVESEKDIDQLLHLGARQVMKRIDPYILASYLEVRGLEGALDVILYCLANEPRQDDPWAYNLWGLILENEGKYERALERFRQAIELKDDFTLAYDNSGRVLTQLGRYSEAEAQFETATRIAPDDARLLASWGESLSLEGRFNEAIEKFELAVSKDPDNKYAYNKWGRALHRQGNSKSALEKFEKVVQLAPNNEAANNNLGDAYRMDERYDEALFYLERAIELNGAYGFAYYNLALLFEEQLKNDKALSCYDKALTTNLSVEYRKIVRKARENLALGNVPDNDPLQPGCCLCKDE